MVAATSAEEKQTLLHAPESDRGSNPTRGSFARLAVAGSLVAGLALAGLASSGAVQGTALAPAGVFQLGAKHTAHAAHPAHASKHKSSGKWWEAEIGESTESSKKAASSKTKKTESSKKESSSSEAHDAHATGRVTPHESESPEKDAEAKDAEPEPAANAADKSQDMLTRLFGDEFGESAKEKTRAVVDPEEQAEEQAKAKAAAKAPRVDPLEEFQEEQAADAARGRKDARVSADALETSVGEDEAPSEPSRPKTKTSATKDEKTSAAAEEEDADSAASRPLAADATESEREAWFEAQRVIKEKQEEKKEAKQEKLEKEEEKKEEEEAKKAAMIPVERERVVAADADSEWFVSFTVTHKERDEAIPCGESHGAAIEEFVGQMVGSEDLTPRVMHVSACENPTPTSRTYDVDFALGDVFDKKKEEASAEAKSLVKLFSTDAVSEMLASNGGLGESEAKAIASAFSVETSKVRFDQRPQFETPAPDPAALLEPFPLSEKHVGHFAVSGGQSDAQIKRMVAQVAVNRGMPADNVPNLNIDRCPFDYRVRFDVTVHGFGCPTGDAAEDGAFGEQYANYVYKYAAAADPPIPVPDSLTVSDCRAGETEAKKSEKKSEKKSDGEKTPSASLARESQTLTVQFDLPRVSGRTDPTKIADSVAGLFTAENIRDHAAAVGVTAHALSQLELGVDVARPGSELVLDPDSKACTFGEVVFNGQLPPELAKQAAAARGEAGGVDDVIQSSSGDRMAMMKELSEQVSSGFVSSSSHRVAMRDEAAAAAAAAATVPASGETAASAATAAASTTPDA